MSTPHGKLLPFPQKEGEEEAIEVHQQWGVTFEYDPYVFSTHLDYLPAPLRGAGIGVLAWPPRLSDLARTSWENMTLQEALSGVSLIPQFPALPTAGEVASLRQEVDRLSAQVGALRATVDTLLQEPGATTERLSGERTRDTDPGEALEEQPVEVQVSILNTLDDRHFSLRRPIAISIESEDDDGYVVARWGDALLEGEGQTSLEAIGALRAQIIDAYLTLKESVGEGLVLAGYPEALWRLYQETIEEH